MNQIVKSLVEKVRAAVRLEDIVSEHVVLKKSGSNWSGLCPFHAERTASFSVSPPKQLFHCYGCKAGGDVFRFVMDLHGLSFQQALGELAQRAKISLGDFKPSDSKQEAARDLAYRVNRFAAKFFRDTLNENTSAISYLRSRGVTQEIETEFYVGLAPSGWDGLSLHLKNSKAPLKMAERLGLIRPSPKHAGEFFDLFRNRVVFPIMDERSRVAGFGGRALSPEDKPKYLNSPESPLFQKSKLLFGWTQARPYVREADEVIVVEGYFDVLVLHAYGIKNVVATCGTALSHDQIQVLKRVAARVILLYDGDEAGRNAQITAMESALPLGAILYAAELPDGVDPDELVLKSGPEALRKALALAQPVLDRQIAYWVESASKDAESKTRAVKVISTWLKILSDPVGVQIRAQEVAQKLKISPALLGVRAIQSERPAPRTFQRPTPKPPSRLASEATLSPWEKILIQSLDQWSRFAPIWEKYRSKVPPGTTLGQMFPNPILSNWVDQAISAETLPPIPFEFSRPLSELLFSTVGIEKSAQDREFQEKTMPTEQTLDDALRAGMRNFWARFSHAIQERLRSSEAENSPELLEDYLDAQKKIEEFKDFPKGQMQT